jgi:rubrerythrin
MYQYHPSDNCANCFENKFCNFVQIPNLPLKGPKSFDHILHMIHKAIEGEEIAIEFYARLLREAPNKLNKEFIERVYNDELEHKQIFSRLYCYYTDTDPVCHIEPIGYPCYKEGLLAAMISELDTVEFYKNVQLSTTDPLIIDNARPLR